MPDPRPASGPAAVLRDAILTAPPSVTGGRSAWANAPTIAPASPAGATPQVAPAADTPGAVRLLDDLLASAVRLRASDLHVEAGEQGATVRLRVDGVLRDGPAVPRPLALPLASRLKILAGLDIADRLRPQDGRARAVVAGRPVDLRVSSLPSVRGENLVVRLSDPATGLGSLEALGILPSDAARLHRLLDAREGLVLVTGPTGSGKTTTLYAALRRILARGGVNVITVEDPVERRLPGVVQVQIHDKAGLTFATALRAILRQDPDVVLVGEVRDRETAAIAAQAAMTGHLVLATLHTVDAASAVNRLADVGVEPFKLAAALRGVVAQRLVRRLCAACRRVIPPRWRDPRLAGRAPEGELVWEPAAPPPAPHAARCPACDGAGYRGRVPALEVLLTDESLGALIGAGATRDALHTAARAAGMPSMWDSAVGHVRHGTTSVAELLRTFDVPSDAPPARSVP